MSLSIETATKSLMVKGQALPGCPILAQDGLPVVIPSKWLIYLWQGPSEDTARTYAQHLKRWWSFLVERRVNWWEAIPDDIQQYKLELRSQGLPNQTVKPMLFAIDSFYKWTQHSGFTLSRPFVDMRPIRIGRSPEEILKKSPTLSRKPKRHTKQMYDEIQASLPRSLPGLSLRDELIGECGHHLGLRRQEVAGLRVSMFAGLPTSGYQYIELDAATTKGRKGRSVLAGPPFLRKVRRYLEIYRPEFVEKAKLRNPSYQEPDSLLLTREGRPVRREYVSAVWALKARAAGQPTRFHMNRHTMISGVVRTSTRNGEHPLRIAKELAGHADERTTARYNHDNGFADGDPFELALIEEAHRLLDE